MKSLTPLFLLTFSSLLSAQNQAPVVKNVVANVNWATQSLSIQYDVEDAENETLTVSAEVSGDNGSTYLLTNQVVFSGDIGTGITAGLGKVITANLAALSPAPGATYRIRLIADDGQPIDLQSLVNEVDSNRLKENLSFVEGIRHRTGGLPHLQEVRDSILNTFVQKGFYTNQQTWAFSGYTASNVIGTARGTARPGEVVIVDAHYDTVINAPGADDNGSGVVGMLEIARLLGRYPAKKTLRYIGFDLEEAGLLGSIRYLSSGLPAGDTVNSVLNFEMIGYYSEVPNSQTLPPGFDVIFPATYNEVANNQFRGNFLTNVGNDNCVALINLLKTSADTYVPDFKVINVQSPGNGSAIPDLRRSDHAPFWSAGLKALMLTDGANFRNDCYHDPCDTAMDKLNFTFMSKVVKATLATAAQLAEIQHAGWGTASFSAPVSIDEPDQDNCQVQGWISNGNLILNVENNCTLGKTQLTLNDPSGRVVWSEELNLLSAGRYQYGLPSTVNGVYILQVNTARKNWSQKILSTH